MSPREESPSVPPAPPPASMREGGSDNPLISYLRSLESELRSAREQASASKSILEHQERLRSEVEEHLKSISSELRREKELRDLEAARSQSAGRVESLEKRLDEMHASWAGLLRDAIKSQEAGRESSLPRFSGLETGLTDLRGEFSALKESLAAFGRCLPSADSLSDAAERLRSAANDLSKKWSEQEKSIHTEQLGSEQRLEESLAQKLESLERRLSIEIRGHKDLIVSFRRDQDSVREALDDQGRRIRQESLKEKAAIEERLERSIGEFKSLLEGFVSAQNNSSTPNVRSLLAEILAIVSRPEAAKEQIAAALEREKRDLLGALKSRSEELRSVMDERRAVEHSLGESLLEAQRGLESERAKQRGFEETIAGKNAEIGRLKAESELREKESAAKDDRLRIIGEERDRILSLLAEEAAKNRERIDERSASENAWERKVVELQRALDAEKQKSAEREGALSDLREQQRSLSEHLSRIIQEKESAKNSGADWSKERESLHESLRKKEEMIAMLSAAFQGFLQKPSPPTEPGPNL